MSLASKPLAHIEAAEAGDFVTEVTRVTQESLFGVAGANLEVRFDGETGSQLLLDNIYVSLVPEASVVATLLLGGLAVLRRKR